MSNDPVVSTVVTRVTKTQDSAVKPMMSFTAVTSHSEMAEAFTHEILSLAQKIMPDRTLSIEDLISICHMALSRESEGVVMLAGRHLRARVSEQLSREARYKEPFSLLVLKINSDINKVSYEAAVDTICERMRKTDLLFTFKSRIMLLLPHTEDKPRIMLAERIENLVKTALGTPINMEIDSITYPSENLKNGSAVLDWVEDSLRK